MKRLFRILCAVSVFVTSSLYLLGINYAAHRLPIHTPKYALAMVLFMCIGFLSLFGSYFVLNLRKT